MKNTNQTHILESFSNYLDIPYMAYDCFELVRLFYERELGITLESSEYLSPKFLSLNESFKKSELYNILIEEQKGCFKKVNAPQCGDIALFNSWGIPAHVGIYINNTFFLHTQKRTGSCVERFSTWKKRLLGFYRYDKTKD